MLTNFLKKHFLILACFAIPVFIFTLLLARNPFGDRTLIPNFEPFPDSFHYLTVPQCWLNGKGWQFCFENGNVSPSVPPLYSIVNLPALMVLNDPRGFYFTNVFLSFATVGLLIWLMRRLKVHPWIQPLVVLLYVLNPYVYWMPTLAMAELLLIPLFLLGLILLTYPVTIQWVLLVAIVTPSLTATKFAAIPLTILFGIAFASKIWTQKINVSTRLKHLSIFGGIAGIIFLSLFHKQIFDVLQNQFPFAQQTSLLNNTPSESKPEVKENTWFSWKYAPNNLKTYWRVISGQPAEFLWRNDALVSSLIAGFGLAGIIWSLKNSRRRFMAAFMIVALGAQLIFMSRFYVADARYLIILLPLAYLGVGMALDLLVKHFQLSTTTVTFGVGVLMLLCLVLHLKPLKAQIGLNVKHAETPWYYLSVVQLNSVFTEASLKKPIVVSAVPRMLIDFYSNGNYRVMPLSDDHDLHGEKAKMFGDYDYSDLIALYMSLLQQGEEVFVMNYGIGNVPQRNQDWQKFQDNFQLELVKEGCYNLCNVWKVTEKAL